MPESISQDKYVNLIPRFNLPADFDNTIVKDLPADGKKDEQKSGDKEQVAPESEVKIPVPEDLQKKETQPDAEDAEEAEKRRENAQRRITNRALKQRAEALARADAAEKRLAEAEQKQAPAALGRPKLENFTDFGEFEKAIDKYAREEAVKDYEKKQRDAQNQATHQKLVQGWEQQVTKAVTQYDDFDEKVGELQPTVPWTRAIMRSENGADVAYYLANHRKEAEAIFSLDPESQYFEIGRLSQKLMQKVDAPRQPSKAPAPIAPVTGAAAPSDGAIKPGQSFEEYRKIGNKMFRGR